METQKKSLLEYSREELEELVVSLGYRPFHGRQIHAWIYRKGAVAFEEMTDLSKALRQMLVENFTIGLPKLIEAVSGEGPDSATKYLFELEDGHRIETVHIPSEERNTVCLSCQVGCAFGCTFCATGKLGLKRNMTASEIVGTFLLVRHHAKVRLSNVVYMGMGEPLANLPNVLASYNTLTDPDGIGLSKRHVTISTVGVPKKIRELAETEYPPKLVFSIASPNQREREKVLPVAGRFTLEEIHDALMYYAKRTKHRITIAMLVAKGLNDKPEDAKALHRWIGDLPSKVNLLRYNETGGEFQRANEEAMERFASQLIGYGRTVILRTSRGRDVSAACGQLAARSVSKQKKK